MNAGDLVKECFSDQVLILGGGIEGERIRIAPPLTIGTEDLQDALKVMLSIMHRGGRQQGRQREMGNSTQPESDRKRNLLNDSGNVNIC